MKALLIIDVQYGLTFGKTIFKKELMFATINNAIFSFRKKEIPIVFVHHQNERLIEGTLFWEIDPDINRKSTDIVINKKHGDAFFNTNLNNYLTKINCTEVVICGLTSHGCVKASCIGALELGYKVSLLKEGHSCWNKDAHHKIQVTEKELIKLGVSLISVDLINPF